MSEYNPDAWVIVRITNNATRAVWHRVLAGWYGGYAKSNSWRMNSGITRIEKSKENPDVYRVLGASGSSYNCHKNAEKTTMLTASILDQLQAEAAGENHEACIVPISEILDMYQ